MPDVYNPWEILPREELRKKKFQKLLKTVRLAFEKVKEFQNRVNKLEISTEKDFEQIPILPKKKLISLQENNFQDLLAVSIQDLAHIYSSPGPLFDPEGREKDYWGWTEAFYAMGFRPGDIVQNTFSYHLTPAGLMMEEPLRTLGCAIIPAGPGNTDLQIELMTKLKATGFVGMASYLKTIGERAQAKGLDL
ncbi:MAG TPA: phenylacetate--CoA ligase, partial [Desulfonauticus sp.]|nr:phenylacetate--CoA ligase [Desulfonauticus sp.]